MNLTLIKETHNSKSGYSWDLSGYHEEEYRCPCGRGTVIDEDDYTPGHQEHDVWINCKECREKYLLAKEKNGPFYGVWQWVNSLPDDRKYYVSTGDNINSFIVAAEDGNGIIISKDIEEQELIKEKKEIAVPVYGKLVNLLVEEGIISFDENGAKLQMIITNNFNVVSMNLLGKLAEAVIVRRCAEDQTINKKWLEKALKRGISIAESKSFKAIGTGLKGTQVNHKKRYNPSDPQRDIIWIDKDEDIYLIANDGKKSGIEAGLQVKVSTNGTNYCLNDLKTKRYEVPVVYFPINDDYDEIVEKFEKYRSFVGELNTDNIEDIFIDVRTVDVEAYYEVVSYKPLINNLISGKTTPSQLIDMAYGKASLQNAILASSINTEKISSIIIK